MKVTSNDVCHPGESVTELCKSQIILASPSNAGLVQATSFRTLSTLIKLCLTFYNLGVFCQLYWQPECTAILATIETIYRLQKQQKILRRLYSDLFGLNLGYRKLSMILKSGIGTYHDRNSYMKSLGVLFHFSIFRTKDLVRLKSFKIIIGTQQNVITIRPKTFDK